MDDRHVLVMTDGLPSGAITKLLLEHGFDAVAVSEGMVVVHDAKTTANRIEAEAEAQRKRLSELMQKLAPAHAIGYTHHRDARGQEFIEPLYKEPKRKAQWKDEVQRNGVAPKNVRRRR